MSESRIRFVILSIIVSCVLSEKVIVINNGPIVGEELVDFYAFRGIPYAEAPVGDLRFAPPKPFSEKWSEKREFKKFGESCSQFRHFWYNYAGSEDCLTVNVFVPKLVADSAVKAPVIFHIHGGAFMFGGGNEFLPEHIMKAQNMIVVTINYRVGILGFLSTEDDVIPGNFGMKDQVEALRWVKKNIATFNGDPQKVTLSGFSAGGASVQLHYMSPTTDGLFNNGISHSGVAIDPWVMQENAKEKSHRIAALLKCPQDSQQLLKCLREMPAKDLVLLVKHFQPFMYNPFNAFGIVVEPPGKSAFLTEHPMKLLQKGKVKKLPWLLSQAEDEGLYPAAEFYDDKILQNINEKWDELAPFILHYNGTSASQNRKEQIAKQIRKHYLGVSPISKENFMAFVNILTDRLFKRGAFKALELQSQVGACYFYHFRFKSLSALVEFMSKTKDYIGVAHGEDVLLIYRTHLRDLPFNDEESTISKKLIDMYYNFASKNVVVYGDLEVEATNPKHMKALEIKSTFGSIIQLDEEFGGVTFWDEIEKILMSKERTFFDEL